MKTRRNILLAGLALSASRAFGFTSPYSPVSIEETEFPTKVGYSDATLKTLSASQTLDPSKRNCVLVIAGQSNVVNTAPTLYVPTNAGAVDNFNIYDGKLYQAVDPLLGCWAGYDDNGVRTGGHFAGRLADGLINAGLFDRVILVPIAVGGTTVDDWLEHEQASRIRATGYRLAAAGLLSSAATVATLYGQGEADTAVGTSQAVYLSRVLGVTASMRSAGLTGRILIAQQSLNQGVVSAAVVAAQAAAVNPSVGVFAGPLADSLGASYRTDGTHFNDAGFAAYAGLWQTTLHASGPPF